MTAYNVTLQYTAIDKLKRLKEQCYIFVSNNGNVQEVLSKALEILSNYRHELNKKKKDNRRRCIFIQVVTLPKEFIYARHLAKIEQIYQEMLEISCMEEKFFSKKY